MSLLRINNIDFEVEIYSTDFALLKPLHKGRTHEIGRAIHEAQLDFIEETICTEIEICIKLNSLYKESKLKQLESLNLIRKEESNSYYLPIYIDPNSKDWISVTEQSGLSFIQYTKALMSGTYRINMYGFLPGFLYMSGLSDNLHIPRKSTPDLSVPAGSIAIGGPYLGLYSLPSPGGWQIIGQTPLTMFDINKNPFWALKVGDSIKLKSLTEASYNTIKESRLTLKEYNAKV